MQKTPLSKKTFYFLFSLLLIGLPFSKAIVSIAFVGLTFLSFFNYFKNKKGVELSDNQLIILPVFLFIALFISFFYSTNLAQGFKVLSSQLDFLAIPFIFYANQNFIQERLSFYLKIFINATAVAAFITFILFLLPSEIVHEIANTIPILKDYVVHEKELAFGVYSPFTERLQFSYLICVGVFFQLWLIFLPKVSDTFKVSDTLTLKVSDTLILVILTSTLLILGARGAQIAFLVGIIIWIIGGFLHFTHPYLSKKTSTFFSYVLLSIGILFFLIIVPFFAYKSIPAVQIRYDQMKWEIGTFEDGTFKNYEYIHFTSIRRLLSWKNSWRLIKKHPVLGVGIGNYQQEMEHEYAKDNLGFPVNTQSQFLYFWTAAGLMGLAAYMLLLFFPLSYLFSTNNHWLKVLICSFTVFYVLVFLFDAPLNFQVGGMTFLVFYCLLGFLPKVNSPKK